jgi:hypothetical protein
MKRLPLLLLPFLPLPAIAAQIQTFVLKDKQQIRGEILQREPDRIQLKLSVAGGTMTVWKNISDFDPHSGYRILRDGTPKDDVAGHIKLAGYAIDNGLIAVARRELRNARDLANDENLDPELEKRLLDKAVVVVEDILRRMLAEGKIKDARYALSQIMQAPRLDDARKAMFHDLVEGKVAEMERARESTQAAEASAAEIAARDKAIKPVQERIDRGKDRRKSALMGSKSFGSASAEFDRAIRDFKDAIKIADQQRRKNPNDRVLIEDLDHLKTQAEDLSNSCLLSQASLSLTHGSYNKAMSKVNQVLAVDENNKQALAMRARIEIAASSGGWGYGGRRIGR